MANVRIDSNRSTQVYGCIGPDSSGKSAAVDAGDKDKSKVNVGEVPVSKRGRSSSSSPGRPHKSPRMQSESTTQMDGAPETCLQGTATIELPVKIDGATETSSLELGSVDTLGENLERTSPIECPPAARRKSLRRSTMGRRSLPACHNPFQNLCISISPSLPQQERLEKLMKASMELEIERTRDSMLSTPSASLETFEKQVEDMQKEWCRLAKDIHVKNKMQCHQIPSSTASDPGVQQTMEHMRRSIRRLQLEGVSWEELLNKHRSKAEALTRKVEKGQESGVVLDSTYVVQCSQYKLIQTKPDYRGILRQQLPHLQTMELAMDSQRKMAQELLAIHDRTQLLVTETSKRLRFEAEAEFQTQSCDNIRHLLIATKDPPLINK